MLDTSLAADGLTMAVTPDVLIAPSDLTAFAKLLPLPASPPSTTSGSAPVQIAMSAAAELKSPEAASVASPATPVATPTATNSPSVSGGSGKDAAAVVVVNPGRLAKGVTGGSYAQLSIAVAPAAAAALRGDPPETNAAAPHDVSSRCRVDILRI